MNYCLARYAIWNSTERFIINSFFEIKDSIQYNAVVQICTKKLKTTFRTVLRQVLQYLAEICGFVNCGLIMKICGFAIWGLAHLRNFSDLQKWNEHHNLRIWDLLPPLPPWRLFGWYRLFQLYVTGKGVGGGRWGWTDSKTSKGGLLHLFLFHAILYEGAICWKKGAPDLYYCK